MPKPEIQLWLFSLPPHFAVINKVCLPHLEIYLDSEQPSLGLLSISLFSLLTKSIYNTRAGVTRLESKTDHMSLVIQILQRAPSPSEWSPTPALPSRAHLLSIDPPPLVPPKELHQPLSAIPPTHQVHTPPQGLWPEHSFTPPPTSRFTLFLFKSLIKGEWEFPQPPSCPWHYRPPYYILSYATCWFLPQTSPIGYKFPEGRGFV